MIALYARISKKDKRVQKVSNTIENQLFLLRSYVSDNAICGEQEDIHEFTPNKYINWRIRWNRQEKTFIYEDACMGGT